MFKLTTFFFLLLGTISTPLVCNSPPLRTAVSFSPFTAKVIRNKVRIRLEPSTESPILKEVEKGEMVVVIGEAEDFYSILPPEETQAFIFRTFVLDNIIEGQKVNVRLTPSLEAPVIAQLNTGDRVDGNICSANSKWLQIPPPQSVRFYIAKDYVEKIGPPDLISRLKKRKQDAISLFDQTSLALQTELQKPFDQINLDPFLQKLNYLQKDFSDFPDIAINSQELLKKTQEAYLHKKIAFLENKAQDTSQNWQAKQHELANQLAVNQNKLTKLEKQLAAAQEKTAIQKLQTMHPSHPVKKVDLGVSTWTSIEQKRFQDWLAIHEGKSMEEFYKEQEQDHILLSGILEPYTRSIKNKPGDFILVNPANHLPIAYLYSTNAAIQDKIGQNVTVHASQRPNYHFAYPAYYVLSIE